MEDGPVGDGTCSQLLSPPAPALNTHLLLLSVPSSSSAYSWYSSDVAVTVDVKLDRGGESGQARINSSLE